MREVAEEVAERCEGGEIKDRRSGGVKFTVDKVGFASQHTTRETQTSGETDAAIKGRESKGGFSTLRKRLKKPQ